MMQTPIRNLGRRQVSESGTIPAALGDALDDLRMGDRPVPKPRPICRAWAGLSFGLARLANSRGEAKGGTISCAHNKPLSLGQNRGVSFAQRRAQIPSLRRPLNPSSAISSGCGAFLAKIERH